MRVVAVALLLVSTLAACAAPRSSDTAFRSGYYTVRHQDTLYSIAWRYNLTWQELARWNGIGEPYTIYPGQRLRMNPPPGQTALVTRREPAPRPTPTPASPTPPVSPAPAPQTRAPPPAPQRAAPVVPVSPPTATSSAALRWQWPAQGEVIRQFSAEGTGKRGIAISGSRGQPVRAAAPGRVVYAGSGLVGYGRLIIVKHNENFLSAYAHNDKLLVNEGMDVAGGQQIAQLGDSGTDRPMLHFEIRQDGRPVDPLRYLPRR